MNEKKVIQALLSEFEKERDLGNKALKQLPRGSLRITQNGPARISFFRESRYESSRKRKGIGRDEALIYQLAHKEYLQEKLRRLNINIQSLRQMKTQLLSLDPEDIAASLPKHFDLLDIRRVAVPEVVLKIEYPNPVFDNSIAPRPAALDTGGLSPSAWARMPYCANTRNLEHLVHRTSKGLLGRSKGEVLVLEKYDGMEIPYHYDEVIEINGRYCSPDVIFARRDLRLIYHEHAGLKTEAYRQALMDKLQLYASAGIHLGENLILTFDNENGGINLQLVDAMIREMYEK